MARVEIKGFAWGFVWEKAISRALSVPVAGVLAEIDGDVYDAVSGGSIIDPADFMTDADGYLPGFIESGSYTLIVDGGDPFAVEASDGSSGGAPSGAAGGVLGGSYPDPSFAVDMATQAELDVKAPIASPTLTGDPKAPTPALGDNDTSIATTAFVHAKGPKVFAAGNSTAALGLDCAGAGDILLTTTLTANCTLTLTNMIAGQAITIVATQDATGGRTLVFSPAAKTPGGVALALSTPATSVDVVSVFSPNGTVVYALLSGKAMV